jgi:hypothetical protein
MSGYVLDTNIVTAYVKRNPLVRQRIRDAELAGQPVRLSAVSYFFGCNKLHIRVSHCLQHTYIRTHARI